MFDFQAFQEGAVAFLLAFGTALLFLIAFQFVYQMVTPHDERRLIREGNNAAAIAFGGALIGYAIPLASAMTQAHSLAEFAAWAALAGIIQIVAFFIVRRIAVPDVSARIERGEVPVALWLGAISIAIGLINAASMTD
jgi:putative membrane protein